MKVYIASSDRLVARTMARLVRTEGHLVLSHWHDVTDSEKALTAGEKREWAIQEMRLLDDSDALVFIQAMEGGKGSDYLKLGIAIGLAKNVIVVGSCRGDVILHPWVDQVESATQGLEKLQELSQTRRLAGGRVTA